MVHVDSGTFEKQLPSKRKICRSTVVKSTVGVKAKENWREMGSDKKVVQDAGPGAEEVPSSEKCFALFGNELNSAKAYPAVYMKSNEIHLQRTVR